jgi:hypothetical protein
MAPAEGQWQGHAVKEIPLAVYIEDYKTPMEEK